jgi:hypothetical protein
MGVTVFQVYDNPKDTEKKVYLEYAVSLPVSPKSWYCLPIRHPDTLVRRDESLRHNVQLEVWDRAIVNSVSGYHHWNAAFVGFCLSRPSS